MSTVKKMNTLVENVFSEYVKNLNDLWTSNPEVQKQLKSLFSVKNKAVERKKDPFAPKRGKSAYLFFCAEYRDSVKKELGVDSKATDVTKELGSRWNILKQGKSKTDKQKIVKYEKMAEEDKSRYETEKSEYVPPESSGDEKSSRRGGKKKLNNGQKRAKSAYLFFCDEYRNIIKNENPEIKATDITSELGRRWKELKEDSSRKDEFTKYESLAAKDKNLHGSEMSSDQVQKSSKEKAPVKGKSSKENKVVELEAEELVEEPELIEEEEDEKPKKGKNKSGEGEKSNAYQSFSNSRRPELKEQFPKMKAGEITKKLGAEWKAMSKNEQDAWKSVAVPN